MAHNTRSALPSHGFVQAGDLCRHPKQPDRLAIIPCSRVTLWRWVKLGLFPAPIRLGHKGCIAAWPVQQVQDWIDAQATAGTQHHMARAASASAQQPGA